MGSLSAWHWIIVLAVIMLFFGGTRISGFMSEVGNGIGSFRRELRQLGRSGGNASRKASDGADISQTAVGQAPTKSEPTSLGENPLAGT
ncbi:twin-arginine translocase TatA/TatE family subunit [Sinorhizobium meliloti]|uniref:twin-arginine translocase TatA/TatE family subunit n=1 Tax=Rhizobium meliloti TaxID=382 RepID=UPI003DA0F016